MFKKLFPIILSNIRQCHHMTKRDKEIAQLYQQLGEFHVRDHLINSYYLSRIRKLESKDNKPNNSTNKNK